MSIKSCAFSQYVVCKWMPLRTQLFGSVWSSWTWPLWTEVTRCSTSFVTDMCSSFSVRWSLSGWSCSHMMDRTTCTADWINGTSATWATSEFKSIGTEQVLGCRSSSWSNQNDFLIRYWKKCQLRDVGNDIQALLSQAMVRNYIISYIEKFAFWWILVNISYLPLIAYQYFCRSKSSDSLLVQLSLAPLHYHINWLHPSVSPPTLPRPEHPRVAQLRRRGAHSSRLQWTPLPHLFPSKHLSPPHLLLSLYLLLLPLQLPLLPCQPAASISCLGCPHWFSCRFMDHTAASSISVVQWEARKIVFDSCCSEM